MAGLSDLTSTSSTVTTTLPSWYDAAQQNLAGQAVTANAPAPNQTAGQAAVNMFTPGNNNAFTTGQGILSSIGSGAVNPWMTTTDANGNPQVVGNPNTAMGGLFNAQTGYLNQIMPNITATPEAANIGSGNFGSLRGETAVDKAKADALTNLTQQQDTSALQNQQTGVQAGTGLGSTGLQEVNSALNTGTFQMQAPSMGLQGQANVLNAVKPGTVAATVGTPSPIAQLGALGSLVTGGTNGLDSLLKTLGVKSGLSGLVSSDGSGTGTGGYTGNAVTDAALTQSNIDTGNALMNNPGASTPTPSDFSV